MASASLLGANRLMVSSIFSGLMWRLLSLPANLYSALQILSTSEFCEFPAPSDDLDCSWDLPSSGALDAAVVSFSAALDASTVSYSLPRNDCVNARANSLALK